MRSGKAGVISAAYYEKQGALRALLLQAVIQVAGLAVDGYISVPGIVIGNLGAVPTR